MQCTVCSSCVNAMIDSDACQSLAAAQEDSSEQPAMDHSQNFENACVPRCHVRNFLPGGGTACAGSWIVIGGQQGFSRIWSTCSMSGRNCMAGMGMTNS